MLVRNPTSFVMLLTTDTLVRMGGLNTDLIVREGEGWRLITSMWMHGGVVHLVVKL